MERAEVRIPYSTLRPGISSGGLHEAPMTSGRLNAEKRDNIPGRHIGPIPQGAYIEEGFGRGNSDTLPARVRHQREEVGLRPFTCAGLPGGYGRP